MKQLSIIAVLFLSVLLFSCNNTQTKTNEDDADSTANEVVAQAEDFDTFYEKFVADEKFQLERLQFPMRGGDFDEMGTTKWTKENWRKMNHINEVDKNEYDVKIDKTETLVKHTIELPNSGFSMNYTFEIIDEKWLLTEYNFYSF